MKRVIAALLGAAAVTAALAAQGTTTKPLQIYVVDTEGGKAALWDDPAIVSDGAGGSVTRSRTASITGAVIRLAVYFGPGE